MAQHTDFPDLPAPKAALIYVEGRSRPYRPAKVYQVLIEDMVCECGSDLGVVTEGKIPLSQRAEWVLECPQCHARYGLQRPKRFRIS